MPKAITSADLFCGAGGFTTGLLRALGDLDLQLDFMLAINHWQIAVATHEMNHPGIKHLCENLDGVDPRKVVPSGRLNIMLAAPECIHHSNARGGRPICDQSRATAWHVLRWAEALYIDEVIVENVAEFRKWGPLDARKRPLKSRQGDLYRQFIRSLEVMGYAVEDNILCAADFGDATTRKRLFIRASRRRRKISWPSPTHEKKSEESEEAEESTWRPARAIIDWGLKGESIYGRKRPLSPNTMRRIMAGLKKYSGLPFIIPQFSGQGPRGLDEPLNTITTTSRGIGLCEPYLVVLRNHADARSLDEPLPAICANGQHVGLAQPFIVNLKGQSVGRSIDEPLPTNTAHAPHLYLAEPELKPFIVQYHGDHKGEQDSERRSFSVEEPLRTIDTNNRYGLAQPYLVKYNGTADACPVNEPLPTISTKDRFGLVEPELIPQGDDLAVLDIHFRMLQPHELAAAMSFPEDYYFHGTRQDVVKQIGNAVPVNLAAALCKSALKN